MRNILLFIALAAMIWSACSKPEPPDDGFNSPVFSVSFEDISTGGGTGLTAGLGGNYLFTRVEQNANKLLIMSGAFADATCPMGDCAGSVKFEFRNEWLQNFVRPDVIFADGQSWEYKSPNDTFALHTVAIQWVTPQGKVFRSDNLLQPQDSSLYFNILNPQAWETNERGESTWKMDVDFSCSLFDSTQQERKIIGSGVIAVGYR